MKRTMIWLAATVLGAGLATAQVQDQTTAQAQDRARAHKPGGDNQQLNKQQKKAQKKAAKEAAKAERKARKQAKAGPADGTGMKGANRKDGAGWGAKGDARTSPRVGQAPGGQGGRGGGGGGRRGGR